MPEDTNPAAPDPTPPPSEPSPDTGKDLTAEVEKWKALARKHEGQAKANSTAVKELEQLRQSSMSEQEKAVAKAREEGRAEGLAAGSTKVAAAEIRAAAAGRLGDDQLATLLEGLNLAVFLTDDGEVDGAKVAKFVDGIAPPAEGARFPDLGQGARGGGSDSTALNGDPLLRDLKSHLGIR